MTNKILRYRILRVIMEFYMSIQYTDVINQSLFKYVQLLLLYVDNTLTDDESYNVQGTRTFLRSISIFVLSVAATYKHQYNFANTYYVTYSALQLH